MEKQLLMGNHAIALAAVDAGVKVVSGYPGTPSSEILEYCAQNNPGDVYIEWSINEKVGLELAAGAAMAGARSMVTMKQVGLNVASDPLMSLSYLGVRAGMVVIVADDPGPISSQTEQDTRSFGLYSKLPVFDPSSPEEAYEMVLEAFAFSEEQACPVILRPVTRVCHGCSPIERKKRQLPLAWSTFEKDTRWVIFPKLSQAAHRRIEERNDKLSADLSQHRYNFVEGQSYHRIDQAEKKRCGLLTHSISYAYTREALALLGQEQVKLLRIGIPHPFPNDLAAEFLEDLDEVLCLEELDPFLERELAIVCADRQLPVRILGKRSGHMPRAGENSVELLREAIADFLGLSNLFAMSEQPSKPQTTSKMSSLSEPLHPPAFELPLRPPVLCAGCPHRASFYAVKQAMKGKEAVFSGDIGCYTLGNAPPLNMVDTCLCMGAGITIAQGLARVEKERTHFAFIGDSTFFASGITGIINALYNQTEIVLIILDNATTAMTGHQTHPGLGRSVMGKTGEKISIKKILEAIGVAFIRSCNPFDLSSSIAVVQEAVAFKGVSAIIFEAPCIFVAKKAPPYQVDDLRCIGCKRCMKEIGCPAIFPDLNAHASIDAGLCYGCSICAGLCPVSAIAQQEQER